MLQYVPVDDFYDETMPHKILRTSYTERMNDYFYGLKMPDYQIKRKLKNFEETFFKYDRRVSYCECCGEMSEDDLIENMNWDTLRYLFNQLSNFEQRFRWFMSRWNPVVIKPIKITEEPLFEEQFEEISCKVKVYYQGKRDYYSDYCFDSLFFLFTLLDQYIKDKLKSTDSEFSWFI